jgi:outer membrane protein TolC
MKDLIRFLFTILFVFVLKPVKAQETLSEASQILTFEEYIGYVKQHHPLLKQANLQLNIGEATLLKARGGFDPKIEVDYDRKKFKETEYYDQLNASFKIPTWYGVSFKANFEENTGAFLDPSLTVPEDGLYSAGVSLSLAQGLLINQRMADLKMAKFFIEQTKADRDMLVNELIFNASTAYFTWVEAQNELDIYTRFLTNAQQRLEGITKSVAAGDKAAIDITEARITVQSRELALEAARLKTIKARLSASNYLWLNEVPIEVNDALLPAFPEQLILRTSLYLPQDAATSSLENHPKLKSLEAKIGGLTVDRSFKRNKLLPKLDLEYNFLSPDADRINTFNTANYKAALTFSMPLFLRKERADVRLANLKLQNVQLDQAATIVALQNKIKAVQTELLSLGTQTQLIQDIVIDYQKLVAAEERKLELGDSSLFLINSREQKLIEATLKANETQVKLLGANAALFNVLGITEPSQIAQ